MRNGYIIDTLTSVDIQEIVKIGGKVVEIYEGVIYRENFKVSPFRKIIDILFKLRQKYKDEKNEVMQLLVKLLMNSVYGEQIRQDIEEKFACKSELWMQTEYDERVKDYWKISNIVYIVKMIDDPGLEDEIKKINTMPLHVGAFVLSNSKRIMNNFIHAIDGFYTNDVYYTDTDSLYIENKHWDKLDKTGLVGKGLLQGKNDYKDGGIFYGLFLAPKIKYCLTITKYGVIDEHKTFKGFSNVSDNLNRKEYFKMADGDKLVAKMPLSWKKSFSLGVVIPHKMRNFHYCKKDILCDICDELVNQRINFSVHLYFNKLSNDVSHFDVAQNFVICTCLSKVLTINFLEDGNRYKVEIFRVYLTFNGLFNGISHFVVAQNFVICRCLSKVLTINFLEDGNRYKVEIFRVN